MQLLVTWDRGISGIKSYRHNPTVVYINNSAIVSFNRDNFPQLSISIGVLSGTLPIPLFYLTRYQPNIQTAANSLGIFFKGGKRRRMLFVASRCFKTCNCLRRCRSSMAAMPADKGEKCQGAIEMTGKTCEIISGNIYRRYIAPCIQFPYIDLTQASYCPIPLIGR